MKEKVENPWKKVKESDLFFEKDKQIIERFNLSLKQKPNIKLEDHDYYIHPDLLPEPYMGNLDANVILLFANPGYGKNEKADYKIPGFQNAHPLRRRGATWVKPAQQSRFSWPAIQTRVGWPPELGGRCSASGPVV